MRLASQFSAGQRRTAEQFLGAEGVYSPRIVLTERRRESLDEFGAPIQGVDILCFSAALMTS